MSSTSFNPPHTPHTPHTLHPSHASDSSHIVKPLGRAREKKTIVTVVGARPQFIKAAVLSRAFRTDYSHHLEEKIVHTGQHYDPELSRIFFDELAIPEPAYTLHISGNNVTGRMMEALAPVLQEEKPDAVLVYGDTFSTLAGALAAVQAAIPVIHYEAGLRSYNKQMPEEINRIVTDHVSSLLLCPTLKAVENLRKEGIEQHVHHVGDIMYDSALWARRYWEQRCEESDSERKWALGQQPFALLTLHRAFTTCSLENLEACLDYVQHFAYREKLVVLFPAHPRTLNLLKHREKPLPPSIKLIPPLGYLEMQKCVMQASFILTDSGGLQKEAYFHRVPCVTLRSETEWEETILSGWNRLWTDDAWRTRASIPEYGDGTAAQSTLATLLQWLGVSDGGPVENARTRAECGVEMR